MMALDDTGVRKSESNMADTSSRRIRPRPVGVLQFHGTADQTVLYAGNIPSSDRQRGRWRHRLRHAAARLLPGREGDHRDLGGKNGCEGALVETGMMLHVDTDLAGQESTVAQHSGCAKNGAAELWTVPTAGHIFRGHPRSARGHLTVLRRAREAVNGGAQASR